MPTEEQKFGVWLRVDYNSLNFGKHTFEALEHSHAIAAAASLKLPTKFLLGSVLMIVTSPCSGSSSSSSVESEPSTEAQVISLLTLVSKNWYCAWRSRTPPGSRRGYAPGVVVSYISAMPSEVRATTRWRASVSR